MKKVLVGDIGGTKTRLAIAQVEGDRVRLEHEAVRMSRDYASLESMLAEFMAGMRAPECAAFGIAGPVLDGKVHTTNLPWFIDAGMLKLRFDFQECLLFNDLEAIAYGLPALAPRDMLTLQEGAPDIPGNAAIIAAGTGLGEAGLCREGSRHIPFATEGGHASFSPQDELELELLRYLQRRHGHVSWERVVSGMGLVALHDFLCIHRDAPAPSWLAQEMKKGDAAAISKAALEGSDEICVETMERFVRLYGAEAGNLALKTLSRGGMYVGGGIAPRILPLLQSGGFIEAFLAKGRMRPLLEAMPVRVILNDRVALYGPALCAAGLD